MIKGKLPIWEGVLGEFTSIESFHSAVSKPPYGFIYMLVYKDGKTYIGKKNLYTIRSYSVLRNGRAREGHYRFFDRGRREYVKKESKWKTYTGSHKECKNRKPIKRIIIDIAFDKKHLTYLEARTLFLKNVLADKNSLNDNILGKFFRKDFQKYESSS